jgi:hypothetical protein
MVHAERRWEASAARYAAGLALGALAVLAGYVALMSLALALASGIAFRRLGARDEGAVPPAAPSERASERPAASAAGPGSTSQSALGAAAAARTPASESAHGPGTPTAASAPAAVVGPCALDVRMVGGVESELRGGSFALLAAPGGPAMPFPLGATVAGHRLVGISWSPAFGAYAVLAHGPRRDLCLLGQNMPAHATPNAQHDTGAAPGPQSPAAGGAAAVLHDQLRDGVVRTGASSYAVRRELLQQTLASPSVLMRTTRLEPVSAGGQMQGFRLRSAVRDWPLAQLGVRDGDVLSAVDGRRVDSPDVLLQMALQAGSMQHLALTVQRDGRPVTLDYEVQR